MGEPTKEGHERRSKRPIYTSLGTMVVEGESIKSKTGMVLKKGRKAISLFRVLSHRKNSTKCRREREKDEKTRKWKQSQVREK